MILYGNSHNTRAIKKTKTKKVGVGVGLVVENFFYPDILLASALWFVWAIVNELQRTWVVKKKMYNFLGGI